MPDNRYLDANIPGFQPTPHSAGQGYFNLAYIKAHPTNTYKFVVLYYRGSYEQIKALCDELNKQPLETVLTRIDSGVFTGIERLKEEVKYDLILRNREVAKS